jgi:hypothetical protein
VHQSREEAIEAIARQAASEAARPGTLSVTVSTNEDVAALNEATRRLRVIAGEVEDARTATGIDGVRIGTGDRIVTRRNDALRGVANRESWTVKAVSEDGSMLAVEGRRQVRLEADYVAEAVQLGYGVTDYGNQGVTTDRSVTLLGEATSAGGLYVSLTRGRFDNVVHLVAENERRAREQLLAAAGRDRADRGLEAARRRAEEHALPPPRRAVEEPRPHDAERAILERVRRRRRPSGVPGSEESTWRSAAELDRAAAAIEARLAEGLEAAREMPVMSEQGLSGARAADEAAAATARAEADRHRGEIARLEGRPGLDRARGTGGVAIRDLRVTRGETSRRFPLFARHSPRFHTT